MAAWLSTTDITRLIRREERPGGAVAYILMGLWRIVRCGDDTRAYRRDLKRQKWTRDRALDSWPMLKLLPGTTESSLPWMWHSLLEHAFNEVYRQAVASLALPSPWKRLLVQRLKAHWHAHGDLQVLLGNKKDADRADRQRKHDRYDYHIGQIMALNLGRGRSFFQQHHASTRHMKALLKALWHDVIDREALSRASRIQGPRSALTLTDILRAQVHRESVERVAHERPQLLPMLAVIHPRHWGRDDLFSRQLWVSQGGAKTPVDRWTFCTNRRFGSLSESRNFRFLCRSPATVVVMIVKAWPTHWRHHQADAVLGFIQSVTPTQDQRPYAKVLGAMAGLNVVRVVSIEHLAAPALRRLARAWVAHRLEVWRTRGYRHLMTTTHEAQRELRNTLDWSVDTDCLLPDSNMGWAAIERHSLAWHAQFAHQASGDRRRPALTWTSPLDRVQTDTLEAVALTDSRSLDQEGREMHHCVMTYDRLCYKGGYLVFSIRPLDTQAASHGRATLGVAVEESRAVLEQLSGPCNHAAPKAVRSFAKHVIRCLNRAFLENAA